MSFCFSVSALLLACGSSGPKSEPSPSSPSTASHPAADTAAQVPTPKAATPAVSQPILVELFTSQGCSSCPSADQVLSELGRDGLAAVTPGGDQQIIPLAFHVDYWNYIGWTDPYSSPRWTKRQRAYAAQLANGRSYTPQLVIHGRAEVVGSRRSRVADAVDEVAAALGEPPSLQVSVTEDAGALQVQLAARRAASDTGAARLQAWVALYQNQVETAVPRGENAGQKLRNDHIVLDLRKAMSMAAAQASEGGEVRFVVPGKTRESGALGVVAFLQDPDDLRVHAVAVLTPEQVRSAL